MYLLYVDMSGNVGQPSEKHLVMAGVCVAENAVHHVLEELEDTVRTVLDVADSRDFELHGSPMWGGRGGLWRSYPHYLRKKLLASALGVLNGKSRKNLRLFGVAVEKAAVSPTDPVEYAYEQMVSRFDKFLTRLANRNHGRHRGLIIVDKSRYEETLQSLAQEYRAGGTSWGKLRNLSEVPVFMDSRASRLLQLADLVSFAMWRRYERGDTNLLTSIVQKFDQEGGVYHGLHHKTDDRAKCLCAACASRR